MIFTIVDNQGIARPCRAVLDSGSQLNFISQDYVKQFKLFTSNKNVPIKGIGGLSVKTKGMVRFEIGSLVHNYQTPV